MARVAVMALVSLLGTWPDAASPPLLLIVREQVRPGRQVDYDRNERAIARLCRQWGGPNAYIALTAVGSPGEVWWLTAWSSQDELDEAGRQYAGNRPLAARMAPLNARKPALADTSVTSLAKAAGGDALSMAGARYVTVTSLSRGSEPGALYELPYGGRIAVQGFRSPPRKPRVGAMVLVIEPRWSLPTPELAQADPEFWGAGEG